MPSGLLDWSAGSAADRPYWRAGSQSDRFQRWSGWSAPQQRSAALFRQHDVFLAKPPEAERANFAVILLGIDDRYSDAVRSDACDFHDTLHRDAEQEAIAEFRLPNPGHIDIPGTIGNGVSLVAGRCR